MLLFKTFGNRFDHDILYLDRTLDKFYLSRQLISFISCV